MKIAALGFTSNIALGNLSQEGVLKAPLKSHATKLAKQHEHLGRTPRKKRYFLNQAAEDFGFKNWIEVDEIVGNKGKPSAMVGEAYCRAISDYNLDDDYYFLNISNKGQLYFFSGWEGWNEDGYELRSADAVRVDIVLKILREGYNQYVYLIESFPQLLRWRYVWGGSALINGRLISAFWPEVLKPRVALNFNRLSEDSRARQRLNKRK